MGIQVLGPLAVDGDDGCALRDRVVLGVLVVRANETVGPDALADALWVDSPPPTWPKVVQGCISRLRKRLGRTSIETTGSGGYVLRLADDQVDSRRFEHLLARAREHLADDDPDRASYVLDEALSLWRGRALPDLDEWEPGRTEAQRLDGLRMDAQELRVESELAAGRARTILEDARALVAAAPLRERRWGLLALALYRSGRQTEALDALGRAKRLLREELGLDPGAELLALEEAILRQDPGLERSESLAVAGVCPYRGLLPYESQDAESFFGRERDVDGCLVRLRAQGALAVVGPSGTGKSSLVRAGVVATLQRDDTRVLVTTPGSRPLDSLAALPSRAPFPVLVVDQCEEVITLCDDPAARSAYLDALVAYPGPVVVALRADRLGELSTHPDFARLVERGLYLLSPMSEENLRAAIEGPARQAGLRLEAGLVDLLVREVEGEPGALPMLSHVLRQTWERREGRTLTVEGYRATGGIRDAVARSAEDLFTQLDATQQVHVRRLLLRLVVPGDDGVPARARVPRQRLAPDESHERLVDLLVAARLVSTDEGDVQIAHEALTRAWPRLRDWLEDDVEGQRVQHHLTAAAEAWDGLGRPDSELYRGIRLAGATEWADRERPELTESERAFLEASRSNAERELHSRARTNRRLRVTLAGMAALLVAALVAGVVAVGAARRAEIQARLADSRRLSAVALTTAEPDLAALLAAQAVRFDNSRVNRSALTEVLGKTGDLVAVARGSGFEDITVSPDGRTVAVTSSSGLDPQGQSTYDAQTLSLRLSRPDLRTSAAEYSPDGTTIAVGISGWERSVNHPDPHPLQVLDADSLDRVGTYGGFAKDTWLDPAGVTFSADGSRLAAVAWFAYDAFEAMVWDTERPDAPVLRVPLTPNIYGRVQLSPDGSTLYVAQRSGSKSLRAYDVDDGRLLRSTRPEWGGERAGIIALSPDGSVLARSDVDGLVVMDAATFEPRYTLAGDHGGVSALAFSPDGTMLAAGYTDGIVVWDVAKQQPARTFEGHSSEVSDVAFSPDGTTLYSIARDRLLLAWDVTGSRGYPGWSGFADSPEGRQVYVANPSPDGRHVIYASYGQVLGRHSIQIRDLTTGALTPPQTVEGARQLLWSPDSSVAISLGSNPDEKTYWLQTWDPETGAPVRRNDRTLVESLSSTSGTSTIPAVGADHRILWVDATTLDVESSAIELADPSADIQWEVPTLSPDRSTAVVPRWSDPTLTVVDLETGTSRDVTLDSYAYSMLFSPDGLGLALYYPDLNAWGVLDVAALRDGRLEYRVPLRTFPGNHAWDLAYSADGSQLISMGGGVVELWDARTLEHEGSLGVGGEDDIATVRPLADGHTLLVTHPRGMVLRWDTRPQHLLDVACRLAGRNLTQEEWDQYVEHQAYEPTCPGTG